MILDNAVEGGKVLIDTTRYLSGEQAIEFIEQSMLLNGLRDCSDEAAPIWSRWVAFEAGKQPRNEGIRVFSDPASLPESDEVITYILPLSFLQPEDAPPPCSKLRPGIPMARSHPWRMPKPSSSDREQRHHPGLLGTDGEH